MSLPNDCVHHATMLKDKERLQAFYSALRDVVDANDDVVDIGAGTGILAAMAAQLTQGEVTAIEYFPSSANCAKELLRAANLRNVSVLENSSFEVKLEKSPQVVVTETIGPIGPEENIVELCYVFKRRHPEVKSFIPSRLKLFTQEVFSRKLSQSCEEYLDAFRQIRVGPFNFDPLIAGLKHEFTHKFHCIVDAQSEALAEAKLLKDYQLGIDKDSSFEEIVVVQDPRSNGVHVYFEAVLSHRVLLSSQYSAPLTHWKHCFVARPEGKSILHISYQAKNQKWSLVWKH